MIDFDSDLYYYDKAAAEGVATWIQKYICHVKGELAGRGIELEDWQKEDIIYPVFGIKRKKDKLRRFRTVYVEIPRKNAKSTLGAAIALYLLLSDGEPGAEVYSAAGDRDQAAIIFGIAKSMIEADSRLVKIARPYQHSITYKAQDKIIRFYKVISAEAKTKHGFNAHGLLFDELHTQPNRELWDVLTTSTGSRRQPLTFAITTAGYDKESICYEIHEYAEKVRAGIIQDDSFLPVVYSAPMESDIYDPETWKAANPGYGSIVKEEYIQTQVNKIKNQPSFESTFRRLHLNQWVGTAETWIPDDIWMGCSAEPILEGECYGGLDLAKFRDVTAFVLYFPASHSVLPFFWVPSEVIHDRSRREGVNYDVWSRKGLMRTTPGNSIDHRVVFRDIIEICMELRIIRKVEREISFMETHGEVIKKTFYEFDTERPLRGVAYDSWSAIDLVRDLMSEGFPMGGFRQGFASMSIPTKELEKLTFNGDLRHGGNAVLRWMASNVQIETDPADNIKINKKKSREKVDGIVALVMAIGESMTAEPEKRSRYEDNPEIESF